jgi:hypothetical protein
MFVSAFLLAAAQLNQIVVPLGKAPRVIEQPKAPIETNGPLWAARAEFRRSWWSAIKATC